MTSGRRRAALSRANDAGGAGRPRPNESWRAPYPGATFVGGTEMYFAELNRVRPEHGLTGTAICYSISPQIHAFTDIDVVENLDAQAETVRSARSWAAIET